MSSFKIHWPRKRREKHPLILYSVISYLIHKWHQKKVERLPIFVTVTNEVRGVSIWNDTETNEEKIERLPMTNGVGSLLIRNVTENSKEETLNLTKSILNDLDVNNLSTMARKMIAAKIGSKSLLENVVELIRQKALSQPNSSGVYAEMCAMMIGNHCFTTTLQALDVTVLQVLLPKCYDVFYSYRQSNDMLSEDEKITTPQTSSPKHNARLLANSVFIAELYNKGVLPELNLWSFVVNLARNNRNAQVHCLATILKSVGSRLSKTYSLVSMVGHLLILENDSERDEIMCFDLRNLIHDVKIQHAKFWIHEEPDRAVKENMHRVNANLIRSNKSLSEKKEYALKLMEHCALVDCWNLISTFTYRKNLNEVKHFMTPALNALMETDQMDFIFYIIITAVKETCPRIRADTGKLLADFVKAKFLSKLIVYTVGPSRMHVLVYTFEKANKDYAKDKDKLVLVSQLESEFVRQV